MREEQIVAFKLNLLDLPHERFYVKIKEKYKNYILKNANRHFGSNSNIFRKMDISEASFYKWRKDSEYPLHVLIKLVKLLNLDPNEIQQHVIKIRSGVYPPRGQSCGYPGSYIAPKFPFELSKELTRIIAHIFGDGCLSIDKNNYIHMQYYNQNRILLDNFKKDISSLFDVDYIYESVNKTTPFVSLSSSIAIILNQIVNTFNSKVSVVPEIIKKAPEDIKIEFIKSFFDDEAYVKFNPPDRRIELTLSNKQFLLEMKNLLKGFGIETTKVYTKTQGGFKQHTIYIRNYHNLKRYHQKINFNHKGKRKLLQKMIYNTGRKSYSHGETERRILDLLKKKPLTAKEISHILKRKQCTIDGFINKLEKREKIKHIGIRNRSRIWDCV